MDLYEIYQAQEDVLSPWRTMARAAAPMASWFNPPGAMGLLGSQIGAGLHIFGHTGVSHDNPGFHIDSVTRGGREIEVVDEAVCATPFGALRHFATDGGDDLPRLLIVAPMSGHFATLLRETARTALADHDVYITDWTDGRDVPLEHGRFGLDEYVDHVIGFLRRLGPQTHVLAVCQPTVATLAATAIMAEDHDPAAPASLTLMGGPIDTRINPSQVNELAAGHDLAWFERNMIATVPSRYPGGGRKVYPGFLQLASFVSMNLDRHLAAHLRQFRAIVTGDTAAEHKHRRFYDEYQAVMDLPGEFYLETIGRVFQTQDLANGDFRWRDRPVRPAAIADIPLFTVEGEKDDICPPGQTLAAHDLCSALPDRLRAHHLQAGVGHYGLFNGSRWAGEIYPALRSLTHAAPVRRRRQAATTEAVTTEPEAAAEMAM